MAALKRQPLKPWKAYERQIHREFVQRYPHATVAYDQKLNGKHSGVGRQVDILVRGEITGQSLFGVFDCKHFARRVDVKLVDYMVGFLDDIGADFGGIVSATGFSAAAVNRANGARPRLDLRLVPFESPEQVVDYFVPSFDFSDPRNSGYSALL